MLRWGACFLYFYTFPKDRHTSAYQDVCLTVSHDAKTPHESAVFLQCHF